MASAARSEVVAAVSETDRTPRIGAEPPAKSISASAGTRGLKDCTNVTALSAVRKRSAGAIIDGGGALRRATPASVRHSLRKFFHESKVHSTEGAKKEHDAGLIEAAKEDFDDDGLLSASGDEMMPSGSDEKEGNGEGKEGEKKKDPYMRLFIGQNEHCNNRSFRRTKSQYEGDFPVLRKRASADEADRDEATERKRSCAIVLNDSTVMVEPDGGDDDVFEAGSPDSNGLQLSHLDDDREGSPMSEMAGHVSMPHRVNWERTQSASVLERGAFAEPPKDHHKLPEVPHVVYELETLPPKDCKVHSVAFGGISAATLAKEMERLGEDGFRHTYVLIDCRYPYEYGGGHIKHAINLHDSTGLEGLFFPDEEKEKRGDGKEVEVKSEYPPAHALKPIFYCEYSQKRGPGMAHELRSFDRKRNIHRYPEVNFGEMYVLEKGYRNFYSEFGDSKPELFSPHCDYVEMKKEKKELGKYHAHRKRTKTLKQLQKEEAACAMSPTTPGVPNKARRKASIAATERNHILLQGGFRAGAGPSKALTFTDSEEEKSPVKKGSKQNDLPYLQ